MASELDIEVRSASPADAGAVAALITTLGYPTNRDEMAERLRATAAHPDYRGLVAVGSRHVLGFLGMTFGLFYERNGSYARLVALSIATEARGTGVGRRLVSAAEQIAATRGASLVVVNSGVQRTGAHQFYERLGYVPTGRAFYKELTALLPT